jgi:hypothetical protein
MQPDEVQQETLEVNATETVGVKESLAPSDKKEAEE